MGAFFDATWRGDLLMAVGGDGGMVIRQSAPLLPQPTLLIPSYGNPVAKSFKAYWKRSEGAERYEMRLLTNTSPRQTLISEDNLVDTTYDFSGLTDYSYFLEVRAVRGDERSNWSKVHFVTTGAAEVATTRQQETLHAFPNPVTNGVLNLTELSGPATVSLIDALGRTALRTIADPGINTIDVSYLTKGSYQLVVKTTEGSVATSVIIQ